MDLQTYLRDRAKQVDASLSRFLPSTRTRPSTLHEAMRYSVLAEGKRLRPILALTAAGACGGDPDLALPAACAVECIHTYSLVHDDLPAMDDDDFRRGRPTSHKVYGEGVAILTGDALLTSAFEILTQAPATSRYPVVDQIRELSLAAGSRQLIAGQVADLEGEGRASTRAELRYIHERKTAAMIVVSLRLGAMSANATPARLEAVTNFGKNLGLAFQVIDDVLDVTQTSEQLGKSAGKDLASDKTTYPSVIGLEASRREARRLTSAAHRALEPLGKKADRLHAIADHMLDREF